MNYYFKTFWRCPKKYTTIIGGILLMIPPGAIGIIGTMSVYYMSYCQKMFGSKLARYPNTIYLLTTVYLFISLAGIIAGILKNKINFTLKKMSFVGSSILSISFILSSITIKHSFLLFGITFSILFGIGFGITFIAPISMATKWFPNAKGKVSSIIFIGLGTGGLLFPELSTYYINPDNLSPQKSFSDEFPDEKYFTDIDLLNRVPMCFLVMGILSFCISLTGLMMVFEKNISNDLEHNEDTLSIQSDTNCENSKPILTLSEALKTKELWLLASIYCFYCIPVDIFSINYKNYGQTFISDDKFLTLINSIASIINIPARLIWGFIIDKLSFKITYLIIITANSVILFTVCFNEYFGDKYSYLVYYSIFDLIQCGGYIVMPQVYISSFGHNNVILINGLIYFLGIPTQLIKALIVPPILENLGYFALFSLTNIFSIISWICTVRFNVKDEYGNDI